MKKTVDEIRVDVMKDCMQYGETRAVASKCGGVMFCERRLHHERSRCPGAFPSCLTHAYG